jgi:hypothetical protein
MDAQFQEDGGKNLQRACGLKTVSSLSAEKSNISFRKVVPWVWEMGEISPTDSTMHFEQVLQFARFAVLESDVGNCQLVIGESGLIFFAPMEARVGGFVC